MPKTPEKSDMLQAARLSLKNPVGFCGHHCNFCKHKFCGGCRSDYIGTSYKVACNGTCPNIECAKGKKLKGCYSCDELMGCKKGYYSKTKECTAKATAIFIKKHGIKCYSKTLKKAVDNGIKYTKKFDATGSVEKALKLLEEYI